MLVRASSRTGSGVTEATTPSLQLRRDDATISPLRGASALAVGGVAARRTVGGCQLVAAIDLAGTSWWIPAACVWTDAVCDHPSACVTDHPTTRPGATGLAAARSWSAAVTAGLSDRLGWEAMLQLDRGVELAPVAADVVGATRELAGVVVLDGRIGHEVPTVIVLGSGVARWGAGRTWAGAFQRAMFGRQTTADDALELTWMAAELERVGIRPVIVDVGADALRTHGITRASVQLLAV